MVGGAGLGDLAGRVLAGRYRLRQAIGTGASGRVYLAEDTRLRRRVAVKVLHAALADDAGFLRRFRAEAQVAASLAHPNIMTVHDWGEDDVPFMVLELLEGGSLRAMLDHGHLLGPAQAARVGREVASALEYAHVRGIVHRDIKPANLLFDEHGIVRVADFGLARALAEASWTEPTGAVLGTARYASPEQAQGLQLDARSDLYSLALVLVEAVTGRVPFASDTTIGTLSARTQRPILAPDETGPLGPVIERAGRIDPSERYPDAATMGEALADAVDALPRPHPLVLAGASDSPDRDPTRAVAPVPSAELFDQDAADAASAPPAAPGDRERGGTRRLVPFAVGLVLVVTVVLGVLALSRTDSSAATVPGLVGRMQSDARSVADAAGLDVAVAGRRSSSDPEGVVLAQEPVAGSFVHDGRTVRLIVSSGPEPVTVPDVSGRAAADARVALEQAELLVTVRRAFDDETAAGLVVSQDPPAGASVAPDTPVTIVVSKGHAPVAVPADLVGRAYDAVAAALDDVGLVADRTDEFSDTVAEGDVISTDPPSGQKVDFGGTVQVLVSKGPDLVEVPDVVGDPIEAASNALENAGFTVTVEGRYRPGTKVKAQDPAGATMARRGSQVTLLL